MAQEQNNEAAAKTYAPLEMEASVRLPIEQQKNLLGFANITFNGALTVTDFKVLQDKEGNLFVGMPSKAVGGKYSPTTWIKGDEAKAQLQNTVLTAYYGAVEKLKARAAQLTGEKPAPIADQVEKAGKEAAEHNAGRSAPPKGKDKNAEL
jgi:DNA-binding cell septation regulator SpoVG